MSGLEASARRKEMLALSWGVEEEKEGGMRRVDRAKSGGGTGGTAVMGALRRIAGSKADGGNGVILCFLADVAS
jgi:hypothetical protein